MYTQVMLVYTQDKRSLVQCYIIICYISYIFIWPRPLGPMGPWSKAPGPMGPIFNTFGPGAGAGTPWARGLGPLGPSYRIHMESVTTYCQAGYQPLSEMHPTTAYMHPNVSAYMHPTTAYFAPNNRILCTQHPHTCTQPLHRHAPKRHRFAPKRSRIHAP